MANIIGTIRDHRSDKLNMQLAITRVSFLDGEVDRSVAVGIVKPFGVLPAGTAGNAGTNIQRFAKNTTSGAGRRLFVVGGFGTYFERAGTAASNSRTLIESYRTDAGDMDGVRLNPMTTFFWVISAKRSSITAETARIQIEIRNDKAAGGEDLLDTVETNVLTASFATYNGSTSGIEVAFADDDQLLLDIYIENEGVPP